ncbi:MAG: hypothetical protein Q4A71_02050 [Actinomycetaceae bacterium]|nr:hypothetical protein [Actinomycetaceae bacterium]
MLDPETLAKLDALRGIGQGALNIEDEKPAQKDGEPKKTEECADLSQRVTELVEREMGRSVCAATALDFAEIQRYAIVAEIEHEGYLAADADIDAAKTVADLIECFSANP